MPRGRWNAWGIREGLAVEQERPKIPAEAVELYTQFIHGEISRRKFTAGVQKFAVAGLTAGVIRECAYLGFLLFVLFANPLIDLAAQAAQSLY